MSNNKQSSVEWYIIERHDIEIQSRLGKISPIEYDAKLTKAEQQAKAMHKEEIEEAELRGKEIIIIKHTEHGGGNNEQQ